MGESDAVNYSPRFQTWLDEISCIDQAAKPERGCDRCGTPVDSRPFLGEYCIFCLAYDFGRFEKAQELAIITKLLYRKVVESSINALAMEIDLLSTADALPLANSEAANRSG